MSAASSLPYGAGDPVLDVRDLSIAYGRGAARQLAVHDVTFAIRRGEAFGLVGESGCGKSTIALGLMRHLPRGGAVVGGRVAFEGQDLLALSGAALQRVRGDRIAMVYQDPGAALNPVMTIGEQIDEVFQVHRHLSRSAARKETLRMLDQVRMSGAAVVDRYPHQLSGGMQQRAVIAMALATSPDLLVLDEPTTGLDATVEAAVLDLVADLRRAYDTAILFISHNLAILSRVCDRIGVLYAGELVEEGSTAALFAAPQHPYTAALLACLPRPGATKDTDPVRPIPGAMPRVRSALAACAFAPRCPLAQAICTQEHPALMPTTAGRQARCFFWQEAHRIRRPDPLPQAGQLTPETPSGGAPLLQVEHLARRFGSGANVVQAVADVSFTLDRGRIFGVVGESGSGKSTLARCVAGLLGLSAGHMTLDGRNISREVEHRTRGEVRRVQMVFQSPEATLNPRQTARGILTRTVRSLTARRGAALAARVEELGRLVALGPDLLDRFPGQLSGGQRQRVAIARAFAGDPDVVLCDEPVSALDVSVQAAILNLLTDLQRTKQVSYVFISHDLAIVRYLADWIGVMYLGRLVEAGPAQRVYAPPSHPYTELLFKAMPQVSGHAASPARAVSAESGATATLPRAGSMPAGCPFHPYCPRQLGVLCRTQEPPWQETAEGHAYRCWIPPDELRRAQTHDAG
ncbi:MAG TPA: ABC transporter ATP-binding protein [Chloroflexota bacterium]|nr:ABC transporter ATP-binding protein [Chloroflexota bacterium]